MKALSRFPKSEFCFLYVYVCLLVVSALQYTIVLLLVYHERYSCVACRSLSSLTTWQSRFFFQTERKGRFHFFCLPVWHPQLQHEASNTRIRSNHRLFAALPAAVLGEPFTSINGRVHSRKDVGCLFQTTTKNSFFLTCFAFSAHRYYLPGTGTTEEEA